MHEMSIATSIVDIIEKEAVKAGSRKVKEIELEIGMLAGIEYDALEFALGIIAPGTVIEGSSVVINKPPGKMKCTDCGHDFESEQLYSECPECKSYACNITGGKELRVKSLIID